MQIQTPGLPSPFGIFEVPPKSEQEWVDYETNLRQQLADKNVCHFIHGDGLVGRLACDQDPEELRNAWDMTLTGHEFGRDNLERELVAHFAKTDGGATLCQFMAIVAYDVTATESWYWPDAWLAFHRTVRARIGAAIHVSGETASELTTWLCRDLWMLLREDPALQLPERRYRCWKVRRLPKPNGV